MRSFIPWVGGKSILAPSIVEILPEHKTYVEVFGGAGWVLFKKDPSKVEVYNDLNGDLVNLFRIVKHRPSALAERLDMVLFSRQIYKDWVERMGESIECEIERAARFYYLLKSAFGSKIGHGWGYSKKGPHRFNYDPEFIAKISERLKRVYIENNSFDKVIPAFDSPETVFYLDPPYWIDGQKFYQHEFTSADHTCLADLLSGIAGKFILSYNDSTEVRNLYQDFTITETDQVRYTMNNKRTQSRKKSELFITNF